MIGDVSDMGVLVCSNELTHGAGNVGYRNKVVVPASCRSKRVDNNSRFYANFRDVRGARVSTLTPHVLKPNADPVVLT